MVQEGSQDSFFENKLGELMKSLGVSARHLVFQTSCHSVAEAAQAAGVPEGVFLKSICALNEKKEGLVVGIIPGKARLDYRKLANADGGGKARLATPEEIREKTGFPAGGTPPFGYAARFFIDNKALALNEVYCGGGSTKALTVVSPQEIIRVSGAKPADITKDEA